MERPQLHRRGVRAGDQRRRRHERAPAKARRLNVLDSNVLIDVLRRDERAVEAVAVAVRAGAWASEVTRFEVLAGMRPNEEDDTEALLAQLEWLPVGEGVARVAAALAREFGVSSGGIQDGDYFVAATAIFLEAQLLTLNVKHFPMFPGLEPAY